MDIVLGATGRVGSALTTALLAKGRKVRAVVRNARKAEPLRKRGASVAVADFADQHALRSAFAGGECVFILTAEDPGSRNAVADADEFLTHCREAIAGEGIRRVVGLSSCGAQHASGTGFLMVSHRLERAFDGLPVETTFIRPSYYYSNWTMSLPFVREHGVLPTFFPEDFRIPMISPEDVADFASKVMVREIEPSKIHEITGPCAYSPCDIARMMKEAFQRDVTPQSIPETHWVETLMDVGFSAANAEHMAAMTAATLAGLSAAEGEMTALPTTFPEYLRRQSLA